MFAGGRFDEVQDPTQTTTYSRQNFVAFDADTGNISPLDLSFDGLVTGIEATADGSALFISGAFSSVNGITRRGLAKYDLVNQRIDPAFAPLGMRTVSDIRLSNGALIAAGNFSKHLMAMDPINGQDLGTIDLNVAGVVDPTDETRVKWIDISPDGTRLVATGNFASVNGQLRKRAFMVNLSSTSTLSTWYAPRFAVDCVATSRLISAQGIDFSPDGSYFVIVSTGGPTGTNGICDAAARFETNNVASNVEPTWINWTGGDTLYSVAVTGAAVYVGGHQRWLDNPYGHDSAGPGAVSRPGIGAIDPDTGMALDWNPTKSRNHGTLALFATPDGLWVGSDGERFGREDHVGIGFAPLDSSGDVTRPNTFIDAGPSGPVSDTTATFSFSADEAAVFQCRIDSEPYAPCTSPVTYEGIATGPHNFQVYAVDNAYNMDATPAEQAWEVVDAGSELIGNPGFETDTSGWQGDASSNTLARVSGGHSGGWAAEISKNVSGGNCGIDDSPNWVGSAEAGSYTASIWARSDTPGVTMKLRVREYLNGSRVGSVTESIGLTSTWQQVALNFTVDSPGSTLDFEAYSSNAGIGTCFQVDDASLKLDVGPPPDTTPPDTSIDSGPSGSVTDTTATFTFSANEPSTFECSLDGGAFAACTSPATYNSLALGDHTFSVVATDAAANVDPTPAQQSWTVVEPGPDPDPGELIGNPGFEVNLEGWNPDSSTNTLTRVSGGNTGSWAVEVSKDSGGRCGIDDSPNWVSNAAAGTYTASVWARSDAPGTTIKLRVREYLGGAKQGTATETLSLTDTWQQVAVNYTLSSPGSTLDFEVYSTNAPVGACFQMDDASIMVN